MNRMEWKQQIQYNNVLLSRLFAKTRETAQSSHGMTEWVSDADVLSLFSDQFLAKTMSTEEDGDHIESQDEEDMEEDFQYYYDNQFDNDMPESSEIKKDPEHFDFETMSVADVDRLLNESVEAVCSRIAITPSIAKVFTYRL